MSVKPIPEGYHTLTPYLVVSDAAKAIDFYKKVFGATERMRLPMGDRIGHAEIEIGNSIIMLGEECTASDGKKMVQSPEKIGGSPVSLYLYVTDADAICAKAVAAGARQDRAVETMFYGDRTGMLTDPFGHIWNIATHVEDVSSDEVRKRMAAFSKAA
jgi:PhnB protein